MKKNETEAPAIPSEIPSTMAVRHEGEIAALKTGMSNIQAELHGYSEWMSKIERALENTATEFRNSLTRATQRNPSLWIGIGTLLVMIILGASALTVFTINGVVEPLRKLTEINSHILEEQSRFERADFQRGIENKKDVEWLRKITNVDK